jgi:hypothetical protein
MVMNWFKAQGLRYSHDGRTEAWLEERHQEHHRFQTPHAWCIFQLYGTSCFFQVSMNCKPLEDTATATVIRFIVTPLTICLSIAASTWIYILSELDSTCPLVLWQSLNMQGLKRYLLCMSHAYMHMDYSATCLQYCQLPTSAGHAESEECMYHLICLTPIMTCSIVAGYPRSTYNACSKRNLYSSVQ